MTVQTRLTLAIFGYKPGLLDWVAFGLAAAMIGAIGFVVTVCAIAEAAL